MMDSTIQSPFHRGEREIHTRLGVRERMEDLGQPGGTRLHAR